MATNTRKIILIRTYSVYAGMCLFAAFIIWYLASIQFKEGKKWRAMADSLSTKEFEIEPIRGNIFDCNGHLLATSMPIYDVIVDATVPGFKNNDTFNYYLSELSQALADEFKDHTATEYKSILKNIKRAGERYFILKRKISFNQMRQIQKFPIFRMGKYKGGLILEEKARREKPFELLAERTIGLNRDKNKVGIEYAFDNTLAGKSGKQVMQRIAGGTWIPVSESERVDAERGRDVVTTLDINLQDVTTHSLLNVLDSFDAEWGTAILMEVETGKIRALANLTRNKANGNFEESINHALVTAIEPGSTFKLASMLAVLEDGKVKPYETFDTEDGSHVYCNNAIMNESEDHGKGLLNLQSCFELSSNIATSKAVVKAFSGREDVFYSYLKKLKLTEKLNLQIRGDARLSIKNPNDRNWACTSLPWMSIGYEVQVTPMHIAMLYNSIANNGCLVKPFFVERIQDNGVTVKKFEKEVLVEKVCSETTLKKLKQMLEGVVKRGTASALKFENYTVAGKTGTAQALINGRYTNVYRASFCGYFPAQNPRYTCYVVVHHPRRYAYYGAAVAGPVFKDIADKVYANLIYLQNEIKENTGNYTTDIPVATIADKECLETVLNHVGISSHLHNDSISEHETDWLRVERQDNSLALVPVILKHGLMPDLQGMKAKDAVYLLHSLGIYATMQGYGKVKYQSLKAGTRITRGVTVNIKLG